MKPVLTLVLGILFSVAIHAETYVVCVGIGNYAAPKVKNLTKTEADAKAMAGYPGGFCPYDMTKIEEGLKYSDVISIMQKSKAKNKFIFADACHSGAIRQNDSNTEPKAGNVLLFLSSRGNEYSAESPFLANGYFTKHLLRGLGGGADVNKDKRITAKELFNYVSDGVKSQTNDRQHPVMWGKFDDDLTIVEYRKK